MEEHTGSLWCCCRWDQVNPLPLPLGGLQDIDVARSVWSGPTMGTNCLRRQEERRTCRRCRLQPGYGAATRVTSWTNTLDRGSWQQQNNWIESAVFARNPRSFWFRGAAQVATMLGGVTARGWRMHGRYFESRCGSWSTILREGEVCLRKRNLWDHVSRETHSDGWHVTFTNHKASMFCDLWMPRVIHQDGSHLLTVRPDLI